jgi:hypothetical protein
MLSWASRPSRCSLLADGSKIISLFELPSHPYPLPTSQWRDSRISGACVPRRLAFPLRGADLPGLSGRPSPPSLQKGNSPRAIFSPRRTERPYNLSVSPLSSQPLLSFREIVACSRPLFRRRDFPRPTPQT